MIYTVTLNPALDKTVQIPRLALGQVNRIVASRIDPGGKGINVAKTIKALGGESAAIALLAGRCGQQVAERCGDLGLNCRFTFTEGETRTNLKVVDPAAGTTTDLNEPGPEVDPSVLSRMLAELLERLDPGDIVVLSGSLPVGAPASLYRDWTERCREKGAKVILDADGERLAMAIDAWPWLVKPNRKELSELAGRELTGIGDVLRAGEELLARGAERVVVSLGEEGALFLNACDVIFAHSVKVDAVSTVGAGDAMVAALALGADRGMDWEETVRTAIAVSAASVNRDGTQAADPDFVQRLIPLVRLEYMAV